MLAAAPYRRLVLAVCTLALLASGCGVNGLNFRQDTRVQIVAPEDRAQVSLPVTLEWEVTDFEITGEDGSAERDAGYFAVFVDRAPQPPGRALEWLARDDQTCVPSQGCPDEEWFARRNVYATSDTSFTIDALPAPREENRKELHEVTIVLLNGQGERIGESAFAIEFEVVRNR